MDNRASKSSPKYPTISQEIPSGSLFGMGGNTDKYRHTKCSSNTAETPYIGIIWAKLVFFGVFWFIIFTHYLPTHLPNSEK